MLTNVGRTKDGYICTLKKRRSNEDQWTVYENISMSGWFNYLVTTGQVKLDTEYHQDDLPDDVSKQPFKLSTFLYSDKTLNNYYLTSPDKGGIAKDKTGRPILVRSYNRFRGEMFKPIYVQILPENWKSEEEILTVVPNPSSK